MILDFHYNRKPKDKRSHIPSRIPKWFQVKPMADNKIKKILQSLQLPKIGANGKDFENFAIGMHDLNILLDNLHMHMSFYLHEGLPEFFGPRNGLLWDNCHIDYGIEGARFSYYLDRTKVCSELKPWDEVALAIHCIELESALEGKSDAIKS